jgi:Domain of unknown function (DUF4395)
VGDGTTSKTRAPGTRTPGEVPPRSGVRELFSFPNPVNEVSARLVAGGVVVLCALTIGLGLEWMTVVIAYGFVARVLTGPTLSPLGQLVTRVVTPRLGLAPRPVAGPPKRFAQGMGAAFSLTALVLTGLGYWTAAVAVLGLLITAAPLVVVEQDAADVLPVAHVLVALVDVAELVGARDH